MDELTSIAFNCRKATFLIEKKQIEQITLREELELKIHLAGCVVCRIFQKQSAMINQMVYKLLLNADQHEMVLNATYKDEMKDIIQQKLNNGKI